MTIYLTWVVWLFSVTLLCLHHGWTAWIGIMQFTIIPIICHSVIETFFSILHPVWKRQNPGHFMYSQLAMNSKWWIILYSWPLSSIPIPRPIHSSPTCIECDLLAICYLICYLWWITSFILKLGFIFLVYFPYGSYKKLKLSWFRTFLVFKGLKWIKIKYSLLKLKFILPFSVDPAHLSLGWSAHDPYSA